MTAHIGNLLDCPTHKVQDRKYILNRVFGALLLDPNARLNFKGDLRQFTSDELANWRAREDIARILRQFPICDISDPHTHPRPVEDPEFQEE